MTVIIPERYREAHVRGLEHYLRTGEGPVLSRVIEIEGLHRHGHEFPIELAIGPPVNWGETNCFTAFIRDISERRRAESELRLSEERFALAAEGSSEGLWDYNLISKSLYCSPPFLKMLGLEPPGPANINEELAARMHPEDAARSEQALADHLATNTPYNIEVRIRVGSHGYRWFTVRGKALRSDTGEPQRMIGFVHDITDRLALEQKIRNSYKLEAIGRLAGGIAHDFNNILYAMLGYGQLALEDSPADSEAQENLELLLKAGHRAKDLIQRILAFSRQTEIVLQPVAIDQVVDEALRLLRATLPSTIELRSFLATDNMTVMADSTQIHQVIINLCTNAAHAMHDKEGLLEVSLKSIDLDPEFGFQQTGLEPGAYVQLTVSDNGHGIPEELQSRVFDPFFTTKEVGEGTGMGLSLVHGIVASHHGAITLYSEPGVGTTFNIYLPLAQSVAAETTTTDNSVVERGTERILVVDDEPDIVNMTVKMLRRLGYEATGISSSPDALALFSATPDNFDLIITDQTMPKLTGEKLAEAAAAIRPIPIVLCTGFSASVHDEALRSPAIGEYLMKPVVPAELARVVRKLLNAANLYKEVQA